MYYYIFWWSGEKRKVWGSLMFMTLRLLKWSLCSWCVHFIYCSFFIEKPLWINPFATNDSHICWWSGERTKVKWTNFHDVTVLLKWPLCSRCVHFILFCFMESHCGLTAMRRFIPHILMKWRKKRSIRRGHSFSWRHCFLKWPLWNLFSLSHFLFHEKPLWINPNATIIPTSSDEVENQ